MKIDTSRLWGPPGPDPKPGEELSRADIFARWVQWFWVMLLGAFMLWGALDLRGQIDTLKAELAECRAGVDGVAKP